MKLTKEIVNERIAHTGITLIGEYTNSCINTAFKHTCGHEWSAKPNNIIQGKGCPKCSGSIPLTKNIINERIAHRNIVLLEEYVNYHTKLLFRHICGHEWKALPNNILTKRGCPVCGGSKPLNKEIVNKRIVSKGIKLIGKYINARYKSTFVCSKGHDFKMAPHSIFAGRGCPTCANNGFKLNKPATLYYIKIENKIFTAYKIGITNNDINVRFPPRELKKIIVLKTWHYEKGKDAYDKEQQILKEFSQFKYTGDDLLRSGNTELFNKDILGERIL